MQLRKLRTGAKFLARFAVLATLVTSCLLSTSQAGGQKTFWIDVRTPAEFASGHVDGAMNIEFQHIADKIAGITEDKNARIHLYCRSGRRSGVAKQTLDELGYSNATNEGGIARALVIFQESLNDRAPSD